MDGLLTAREWTALWLSLKVAVAATLAALPLAVAAGHYAARRKPGAWLVELAVSLPLVLPPVVVGYLLLVLLGPQGPVGSLLDRWFGAKVVFTWWAAALASAVVGFPLAVRSIRLAIESVDPRLETVARTLGAGRWRVLTTVTLPLARRGIVAGAVLCLARSFGEFGATIMVAGNIEGQTRTVALAIFTESARPGGMEGACRLVGLSIGLACAALAASEWLQRRRPADAT